MMKGNMVIWMVLVTKWLNVWAPAPMTMPQGVESSGVAGSSSHVGTVAREEEDDFNYLDLKVQCQELFGPKLIS